jgi:hypothetical protein
LCELPDEREVFGDLLAPLALLVFTEGHIKRPAEIVLHLLMTSNVSVEQVVGRKAADVVVHFRGFLATNGVCLFDLDDAVVPLSLVVHPYDCVWLEGLAMPDLRRAVTLVHVNILSYGPLKASGVYRIEHAVDGVVGRYAVG